MAEPFFGLKVQGNLNVTEASIMRVVDTELKKALNDSLKEGKKIMQQEIEDSKAVASGQLLRSVSDKIEGLVFGSWVYQGQVYFKGLSDERVKGSDTGRGPGGGGGSGTGFYSAILAWTAAKGIDPKFAYPIMRKLIKEGTNTGQWPSFGRKPFIADATLGIDKVVKTNFERAAERIARRMQQNADSSTSKP